MDGNYQSSNSSIVRSLFRLDSNRLAVPVNGFLMPIISAVTLVNNAFVLAILLRRQMRSPTNTLLIALAVSDTLTIVCPVPCFVHFYTVGQRYLDWVPYSWCFAYFCLTDYLPTVFHTTSIWLTAWLAVQRYVYVCCPVESIVRRRLCTIRSAVCAVVGIYLAAVASQSCRLGELTFSSVRVPSLVNSFHHDDGDNGTAVVEVTACRYELTPFVARYETVYFNVYYWSRVLLIHVIPCLALVVLNTILIRTMRAAHRRRCQLSSQPHATPAMHPLSVSATERHASQYEMQLQPLPSHALELPASPAVPRSPRRQHGDSDGSRGDSSIRATMMLVTVVGVFLVVEVPLSMLLLFVIIENTFNVDLFSDTTRYTSEVLVNCCIAITYPLNFFIYCTMSERFRSMFCDVFCRRVNLGIATTSCTRRSARTELE